MAEETIITSRLQQASKTESQWKATNPVLMVGELAFSSDVNKLKIGDGGSAWSALPYLSEEIAWDKITSKPTTISGYGISDANIASGTITIGGNSITPLTSESSLNATKLTGTASINTSGSSGSCTGNAASATTAKDYSESGSIATALASKIDKLDYEWNKAINFGSTGALLVYKGACYDTNITIDIDASTSITYHATFVIATQNSTVRAMTVYGDPSKTIAKALYVVPCTAQTTTGRIIEIYFAPSPWSKNLVRIRATGVYAAPTNICERVDSVPTTATSTYSNGSIINALDIKANAATTISGYGITDAKIVSGVITLGSNTITPLTAHQDISGKADKATTLAGYGITDAKIASGVITLGSNTITPLTKHQDISGKADKASTLAGYGITDAKIASGVITLGSNTITPLTSHQDISGKADKAITLAGYGITDAKIVSGVITLGSNTITPLTSHQDISGKADKATTLAGYGITDAKIVSGVITLGTNTITPLTKHQDISGKADKSTTLAGYGITDAKIVSGVITLGSNTITPLTSHQDISGKADKATTLAGYGITDAKIASGVITLGTNSITPLTQHQSLADYAKTSEVTSAISEAIKGVTSFEYSVVESLPATGQKGIIYLIKHSHGDQDLYDEYIWTNNAFEKIGNTDIDLSNYLQKTDISTWAKASSKPSYAFSEITSKPTTISGYGITDAKIASGVITIGGNTITPLTSHQDISGKADKATTLAGYGITDAKIASGVITLGTNTITPLTKHQDISGKADKATTLAGYGITDAQIASGVITLGGNSITPLTSDSTINAAKLSGTASINTSGSSGSCTGNAASATTAKDYSASGGIATALASKLDKLDYEWNKAINFGSSGALLVYKGACYDTNITIDIDATTYITYHATFVIATQNSKVMAMTVYDDPSGTITKALQVVPCTAQTTTGRIIEIYFAPSSWSKNLVRIRATGVYAAPTNICEKVDTIPATATSTYSSGSIINALDLKATIATTISGYGITDAKIASGVITLGSNTITPLTKHQDISGKADKATTLAGYGITDAKIASGVITLGSNTITPLTQHQDISGKVDKVSGKGLSTNDYTDAEKVKLAGIADNATANKGTVTSIATGTGLSGGTITTSGTISLSKASAGSLGGIIPLIGYSAALTLTSAQSNEINSEVIADTADKGTIAIPIQVDSKGQAFIVIGEQVVERLRELILG